MRAPSHPIRVAGLLLASVFAVTATFAELTASSTVVLTNAEQILHLTAAQAAQSLPVRLRGVVVDESQPRERALILADQTTGIYLLATTSLFAPFHRKDLLEIKGVTSPGEFAPCVLTTEARKVGSGPTPAARPVTYQQLITGALDAQFVEIAGVVRQCWPPETNSDIWRIVLAADGGILPVRFSLPQDQRVQEDAEVRIQAVCLYQFNQKRQVLNPVLQVPRGVSVHVEKLQPADPYAVPLRSSASLLQFTPEISYGHRVHVRGIVTCSQPGSLVWIRDESSGLRIQTRQQDNLLAGDEIDVLGFPSFGPSTPLLEDAIYRKIGATTPPAPLRLTDASAAYNHQDDLVAIEAMLVEINPILDGLALSLEQSGAVFKAILKQSPNAPSRPDWQPGSLVRVTGICTVIYDDSRPVMGVWHPQSFQILLRSPADLTIIKTPPWWTPKHIIFLLGIVAVASLSVSGVVMLLARRRLNEQARRRAMAEAEFAAILSERNRLAREIHDTLAQGLTATSVQLRLAKKHANGASEVMSQHLDIAQQLVRGSLEEARNSIWNMRSQVLETGDLASALESILKHMVDGTGLETDFEVTGRKRRLAPVTENNLLRVGQEAITNAAKHARAKHIKVTLEFGEKQFSLAVVDDGCGFDPANPRSSDGGFGLVGMQERAIELKGELKVRTARNQGTEINLYVPLSGE
jgi:signal transduction histidine kinase